jgi:putative nucleotidyltransferase with HDIG domain
MNETEPLTLNDVRASFPEISARFQHICGVVNLAEQIERSYGDFDGKLVQAALYHDLGYSKHWIVTGFHPVDGAIAARNHKLEETIVRAILHHGGSWREARVMYPDLDGFYGPECLMMETPLSRALTYCDFHTGPQGQAFSLDARMTDIRARHSANKPLLDIMEEYHERFKEIDAEWQAVLEARSILKKAI